MCNARFTDWFAVDAGKVIGRSLAEVLGSDNAQRVRAYFDRAFSGETVQYERQHRFADGRSRHLSVQLVPRRDSAGVVISVGAFGLETTEQNATRSQLQLVSRRLESVLEASSIITWEWDLEQDFVLVHGRSRDLLGTSVERVFHPAAKFWAQAHHDDVDAARDQHQDVVAGRRERLDAELRLKSKAGHWIWMRIGGHMAERLSDGTGLRMLGTLIDITREREADAKLRDAERRFRALVELTSDWYWEQGPDHRITRIEGFDGFPGFDAFKRNSIGKTRWELHIGAMDAAGWARHRAQLDAHKPFELTLRSVGPSGDNTWIEIKGVPDFDVQKRFVGYHGTGRDVTKEIESKRHIAYLAQHDMLTGLVNRDQLARLLDRSISAAAEAKQNLALIYLDIDHFKHVNDAFGHNIGDAVLREIAMRINRMLPPDAEVGRVGGDEFMIFWPRVASVEAAFEFGRRLVAACAEPMKVLHTHTVATVSAGMSMFPDHGNAGDLLMNQADMALHEAKAAGRNCCLMFNQVMRERANMARNLEQQLRKAIVAGEFNLAWQPRVDLHTGVWAGGEALLRWPAAQQLKIGIQQVIEVAERAGLINDLGLWVAQTVCDQLESWQQQKLPGMDRFCGSLNVSVQQLGDDRLFALLRERVKRLTPGTLEIEITESTLLQEVDITLPLLQELRSMGVRLALDDFGSGYSHFAQLRRLPIDVVKVDKSLVDDIATDSQALALVEAVRALGKGLGMEMVAEGVEYPEQAKVLADVRFEYGQGYLWQRPTTPEQLVEGVARSLAGKTARVR